MVAAETLLLLLVRRLPPMPAQPTPVERLARWAALVSIHPESGHFDARRFVQDMVNRNILFTLHMVSRAPPTGLVWACMASAWPEGRHS